MSHEACCNRRVFYLTHCNGTQTQKRNLQTKWRYDEIAIPLLIILKCPCENNKRTGREYLHFSETSPRWLWWVWQAGLRPPNACLSVETSSSLYSHFSPLPSSSRSFCSPDHCDHFLAHGFPRRNCLLHYQTLVQDQDDLLGSELSSSCEWSINKKQQKISWLAFRHVLWNDHFSHSTFIDKYETDI